MDDRSERPASRGMRKRGFLILTGAFAAVAQIDGAEAQTAPGAIDDGMPVQDDGTGCCGSVTVECRPAVLFKNGS